MSIQRKVIIGLIGLFLVSTGVSYLFFSLMGRTTSKGTIAPQVLTEERKKIDVSGPKTEECPLNGKMYTKAEKDIWAKRAPLGVMIENHEEARPQSGLSSADVVYEAVAEGAITRFLAIFYCGAASQEVTIGPVRSARTYFMDWVSEYGESPLYAHVGGANTPGPADALGQIKKYGWDLYNDLNQFSIGFPTFKRDYERIGHTVATEHTMYSTTDKLWQVAANRGLTNVDKNGQVWDKSFVPWKFEDGKPSASPTAGKISFPFWEGYTAYGVSWTYDANTNTYKRENGGKPHIDLDNNQQLSVSNVVVMFTTVKGPIDDLKHMLYTTTGRGKVLIFQNGNVVEGTWSKASRVARTKFIDNKGKEISFVRGPIWIEVLQNGTKVAY